MSGLRVYTARETERLRHVAGPGDLNAVGEGSKILVRGEPGPRDFAHWGGHLGAAVLRGASIRREP